MKTLLSAFFMSLALPVAAADISSFSLDNGMQVVVVEDHRAPVVVQTVWYKVGAADEVPGKSGIAHFLEHLMFKGTDKMEAGELSATVTRNGGSDNAFTSWDYTAYYQRVAADRLPLMMEMEADRMRGLQMTEDDVATERNVVLAERNQRTDSDPDALFREQMRAAQFLNHGYSIPIIGWRHEIEQLNREDAFAFYRQYYAPNNAILVVAGDVDPDEVKALAETYYGPIEPTVGLQDRVRPTEPPQLAERRMTMRDARVSQPYVTRSYIATERNPGDQSEAAALEFLASLLGGDGATSYLGQALMFEDPKAIYVSAFYNGTSVDLGSFGLVIAPVPGVSLEEAEIALDATITRFLEEGVDLEQFDRLKTQLRASLIYEQDNIESLARGYGQDLTIGLNIEDVKAWPEVLDAVTPEDVMAAARRVFNKSNAVTGFLMPEIASDDMQEDTVQ
ncbi:MULTISPECIES: M16 family metallopeptidase [Pacificibacter]|uniref:M16 family metallopeptidase n=1 Tax=Pacificibacter TaxID=1042323 RepID=UPI001C09793F|nr:MULTISPECIES: pitrilysin family protein [Pacificibacter]MBU2935975.1 insulinase family protein [Pacificibacter marinus]MDO6615176.1 pitrilysin family protein [Pacificibacter sp. 1_MG-2023]